MTEQPPLPPPSVTKHCPSLYAAANLYSYTRQTTKMLLTNNYIILWSKYIINMPSQKPWQSINCCWRQWYEASLQWSII